VALAVTLAAAIPPLRPPPGRWWLVALDVGQGDALALGFEDGWWLVDAGPRTPHRDAGEAVVLPFLRWAGVRSLGRLVVTHDDGDHAGGVAAVRRALPVARLTVPPALPGRPGPGARFGGEASARGDTLRRSPPAIVRWPPRAGAEGASLAATAAASDNRASLVIEVGEGRGRALLAADVDSTVERDLTVAPDLAALKVAHHGSGSSSGATFLARSRPRLGVISCARRNPFGHPDAGVLARLAAAGARVARTDREGAIWLELSDAGVRRLDWRREPVVAPRAAARLPLRSPHW
jgi:competence protein ComEC